MAEKRSSYRENEQELSRQIEQQDFKNATLICGDQDYLREKNAKRLIDAMLPPGDTLNLTIFRGAQVSAAEVIGQSETLPLFSPRRVIRIEESSFFAKPTEEAQKLAQYIPQIPKTSFLIFIEASPNATYKLCKAIKKNGSVLRFDTPDEGQLRSFAASLFANAGLSISGSVLNRFLLLAGTDMLGIESEAQKLISYCLGQKEVRAADIDAICTPVINDRIFDMISAIVLGKQKEALAIYMDLLKLQTAPQVILSLMIRQYAQLLEAGELQRTHSEKETAAALGVSVWVLTNRLRPALSGCTRTGLENALEACVKADYDYKRGKITAGMVTEELIVILSGKKA